MLYFIEGENAISQGLLERHGLSSLLDQPHSREQMTGPGNQPGIFVVDESCRQYGRNFAASEQRWIARHGYPGSFVGVPVNGSYEPSVFVRRVVVAGPEIELNDGNKWTVPRMREWRDDHDAARVVFGCPLPCVLEQDVETGLLVPGRVVKRYEAIWNESCAIADEMLEQMETGRVTLETERVDAFVGSLLNLNYRVSLPEISLLGLLDQDLYRTIIQKALDWEHLVELVKKLASRLPKEAGGTNSVDTDSSNGGSQPTADSDTRTIPQSVS